MDGLGTALEHFATLRPPDTPRGGDDANKVWYLRQNRLFGEATEAGVVASEHLFTMCEMARGTRVFDLGDTMRVVYMVKRGAVRIARETRDGKEDRKSTRLNSSHQAISYAVFCLKKKT